MNQLRAPVSSGTTAKATTSDTVVTLIAASGDAHPAMYENLDVINEGAAPGFVSVDGGSNWMRLPANGTLEKRRIKIDRRIAVTIKRIAGGTNLSGVYGEIS